MKLDLEQKYNYYTKSSSKIDQFLYLLLANNLDLVLIKKIHGRVQYDIFPKYNSKNIEFNSWFVC